MANATRKPSESETVEKPAQPLRGAAKASTSQGVGKAANASAKPLNPAPPRKHSGDKTMSTAKQTLETMTAASNEAIKDGFEKSMNAMNDLSAFQKDTVDAVIASSTTAAKSLEGLNAATLAFARKSMEDGVAVAKSMAAAKSVQELIEIQSSYTKASLDALLAEVNKNSDLMSVMLKDSVKPLNERFSAAVELMQSQR